MPLRDATGAIVGRIWADEPEDRLLPSQTRGSRRSPLFARQATMAIVSAGQIEQLRVLADQDPLTGLPNRRAFMRELEHEVERARALRPPADARRSATSTTSSCINDTLGHPAGDRALCARRATRSGAGLRGSDGAFRLGGDEFALLLPETTPRRPRRSCAVVDAAFERRRRVRSPTCGWAAAWRRCRPTAADAETLIRRPTPRSTRRSAAGRTATRCSPARAAA